MNIHAGRLEDIKAMMHSSGTANSVTGRTFISGIALDTVDGRLPRAVPFRLRVRELLLEAGINVRKIARINPCRIPSWLLSVDSLNTPLTDIKKKDTPFVELRDRTLERIASYCKHVYFYTDGSKTDNGVGCAFVSSDETRTFALQSHATVFCCFFFL